MKRFLVMLLAAVIACLALAGCSGGSIVGKWEPVDSFGTIEFKNDGTCAVLGIEAYKWSQSGNKIKLTSEFAGDQEMTIVSISGDKMVLSTNGSDQEFKRVS